LSVRKPRWRSASDAAGENLDVVGHKRRNFGESARKFPPFGEVGHELSEFVVDL
jgi:hypothetical protein